jgi:hypothetical protein
MENLASSTLTDAQKREVCAILSVGCDRLAAAKYVGCSWPEIRSAMQEDGRFAAEVRRAEAGAELTHMRNVQNAARDDKHWRASVWWLERRSPERYGRREAGAVTPGQLERVVGLLAEVVSEEIRDAQDRQRLLERLGRITDSLREKPWEGGLPALRSDVHEPTHGDMTSSDDDLSDDYSSSD